MPTKDSNYNPWWAKIVFDEFVSHFIGMSDQQKLDDLNESFKAVLTKDSSGSSFGAKMVALAQARIVKNRDARASGGSKGGRPSRTELVKAPDQLTYGACENVYLTQEQFNELAARVGNLNEANALIDNLSFKLSDGSAESKDHFATLCYWAQYRKEKGQQMLEAPKKESQMERNFRIANEAMERISRGEIPKWRP